MRVSPPEVIDSHELQRRNQYAWRHIDEDLLYKGESHKGEVVVDAKPWKEIIHNII